MTMRRFGVASRGQRLLLCMAVAFALAPMQAMAIGMGAIEVKSRLDQPFVAEIPLTLNDPSEANDLIVHLASPEAFARIGLDRSTQVSANLTFTLARNERGEHVIRVTTPQKMHDPFVSFLLEADWGKGKMVREYTALLDPPRSASVPHRPINMPQVASTPMPAPQPAPAPPAPMVSPPSIAAGPAPAPQPAPQRVEPIPSISAAAAPVQASPPPAISAVPPSPSPSVSAAPVETQPAPPPPMAAPQPSSQPIAAAPQPEPSPPPPPAAAQPAPTPEPAPATASTTEPAPAAASPDSVTVEKGDTLSQIAGKVRPDDVSINRMMIVLQRANPDAFIHSNINLLKSGAVLRIPGSDDTQAPTAAEADSLVHEQVESWRQGFQAAPSLQPEEGAETAIAKRSKPTAPTAPAAEKPAAPAQESAKPTEAVENAATPASATANVSHRKPRTARLEIVPPVGNAAHGSQSGASEGGSGSELRAQLTQTKEELAARNAEVTDLKSRVADLEKIQKDSQQLISMKDSQLAAMQQKLAELEKQRNASAPASAASAMPPAVAAAPAANATAASTATATTPSPATTAAATASVSKPSTPTPAKHQAPPAEPADQTPFFMQAWFLLAIGSLMVAGLLFLFLRKSKPKAAEPASRPRGYGNGVLAASLASAKAAPAEAKPEPAAAPSPPAVTGRSTVTDPLPPAPPPASKPYWTGPVPTTPVPEPPAASSPPPAAAPQPPAAPAKDDWAIDEKPAALSNSQEITKEHPVVPDLDDPNQTVATKLELARAYIDIGDHDGARGMLEEVLIEGNAPQQEEAFKLLDTLDS